MSKNVIINGREYGTQKNYEGRVLIRNFIEHDTLFFVEDLEEAGITVEEVKPKFEDLPAGYYASTQPDWGDSAVYNKTPGGVWFCTSIWSTDRAEDGARHWFEQGVLAPLAWAVDTDE